MGVKGLWKLIECSGVPVPLETLEHKILAVDVSIWLHQAVRGFRGPGGAAVANAHLLTLFHRICKLLFYRIRPVFVFDGGVPHLKKQTLASRRLRREVAASKAKQVRERLLSNLMKSQAVRKALGKTGPGPSTAHVIRPKKVQKDIFELPPLPEEGKDLIKSEPVEEKSVVKGYKLPNLHQFEFESKEFKALPLEAQHEILSELQGTRKENSWSTLNEMPQESKTFAEFQMERLMKRYKFQSTLDDIRTEMQKKKAAEMEEEMFGELEKHVSLTQRIVSEDAAHSIFIKKINDTQKDPDTLENILKEESKEKTSKKRSREEFEKDFLTELEKQGIVKAKHMSDSESDSDIDDDYYDFSDSKNKDGGKQGEEKLDFDGNALLKVVSSLLDNDGLSQDEILTLIKQGNPNELTHKMPVSIDGPSTSGKASGFVFNPDVDSSDDDGDFIEVSEPNSPGVLTTEKIDETDNEDKVDNVKKVLETKNNSLWIKIMQQRLDDLVHSDNANTSPKKARVDSRSMGPPEQKKSSKVMNDKSNSISISLDFDITPLKMEEDIFADVFTDKSDESLSLETKPAPEKKRHSNLEAITRKLSRYSDVQSKQESAALASKASLLKGKMTSKIESDVPFSSRVLFPGVTQNSENVKKIELKSERKELGKEKNSELKFKRSSDDSDSEKSERKDTLKMPERSASESVTHGSNAIASNYDEEAEVDDVEIMSSSGDSESETEKKDSIKELTEDSSLKKSELISTSENNQSLSNSPSKAADLVKETTDVKDVQETSIRSLQCGKVEEDKSFKIIDNIEKGDMSNKKPVALSSTSTGEKDATLDDQDSSKSVEQIARSSDGVRKSEVNGLVIENYEAKAKSEETTHKAESVNLEQDEAVVENKSSLENEISPSTPNDLQENVIDLSETNENGLVEPERPLDYSEDELKRLEGELADEQKALVAQAQKVERISTNLNDQMYGESQHLLQLFGIPYLVAPMEAEAQCGFLDAFNLTSGTITDDSDIFLFGGTKVYKNFFNQARHVEFFKTDNIIANLGLNRDKMITLALLTGSDYTEGIESVGAVSAMEVLTEFPGEGIDCLRAFKKWWNVAHKNVSAVFFSKVRQKMAQVHLPESFPSENIFKAYLEPEVDESKERFTWAVPNVDALRLFTMEKFGWNRAKADEILLPVMKKLGVKTTQMRIDSFFTNIKLVKDEKVHSKRMQDAIAKAKGEEPPSAKEGASLKRPGNVMRKKAPAKRRKVQPAEESSGEDLDQEEEEENIPVKKPSRTLLIDPSEGSRGPEAPVDKPKAKGRGRKKKEGSQEKKSSGPSRSMREVEEDYVPPRKMTKEIMYEALLKKQTISQREDDKQKMEDKKKLAAELLKKKSLKGKKNR